jgi:hypothetical protein
MNTLTADEIKSLLDAAGIEHEVRISLGKYHVMLGLQTCPCFHDSEDSAYQCVWESYIYGELI